MFSHKQCLLIETCSAGSVVRGIFLYTLQEALCVYSIFLSASQSSGARSIPSNARAHTFVCGQAVTMDSCEPWRASQA